jgi:phosphatidylglycerol---prolipoprotein diacylglyceryl transferase
MGHLQDYGQNFLNNLELVTAMSAMFFVVYLGQHYAKRRFPSHRLNRLDIWLIVGVLLGGRIGAMIPESSIYLDSPVDFVRLNFGLSLYGAIGGGALALMLFGWRRWKFTLELADLFSLYLPIGIGLFSMGCLMYGFCGGRPAPLPLGIPLPGHVGTRYPSDLFEGILALGLFLALLRLSRRGLNPGTTTGMFLIFYPLTHALVSLTRFSTGPWPWADLAMSLSLAAVGLTILLLIWFRHQRRPARA